MRTTFLFTVISALFSFELCAQNTEIILNNPSFEELPHKGGGPGDIGIRGWYDCGALQFPSETPPDIHPINAWEVSKPSSEGRSYLGLVVRDNDSWESVSQRLRISLEANKCYSFSADLSRSRFYISHSRVTLSQENYTEPTVLRLWGGTGVCGRQELLGESSVVSNDEWKTFYFKFEPTKNVSYFTVEAFYKVPVLFPYNGHLLVDNASAIIEIPCDVDVLANKEPGIKPTVAQASQSTKTSTVVSSTSKQKTLEKQSQEETEAKPRLIAEFGSDKFNEGQVIRVHSIYFKADSSSLADESGRAIAEIFDFLKSNKNIVIEIGGHTSTIPGSRYCDKLSSERAREVAVALVRMGISPKRLTYKGYGKRRPIITNDKFDMAARQKNQRVEIKILSTSFSEQG